MLRPAVGLLFFLMVACKSSAQADEPQPEPAGAYSNEAVDDPEVVETADHALELLRKRTGDASLALVRIEHAETQVVAGQKTRLKLLIKSETGEREVTVVVFRSLQDKESLSEVDGI